LLISQAKGQSYKAKSAFSEEYMNSEKAFLFPDSEIYFEVSQ